MKAKRTKKCFSFKNNFLNNNKKVIKQKKPETFVISE